MKRTIKNIVNLILVVSLISTLWGCGNKSVTKAEKGFQMYYVNTANTKLVTVSGIAFLALSLPLLCNALSASEI